MDSNFNYVKSNAHITSRGYWESLNKVMTLSDIKVNDKLALAKFKSDIAREVEKIADTMRGYDQSKVAELMSQEYKTQFTPIEVDLNHLTADDMYQLEGIINLEV